MGRWAPNRSHEATGLQPHAPALQPHALALQPQRARPATRCAQVDDYREAYTWLRQHTALDARVLAWWDYGYQISGMAQRTTLADGNTWNHEHIALVGLCLTSPEAEAHALTRHLADYVLVWKGGASDDLAKSAHMARAATRPVTPCMGMAWAWHGHGMGMAWAWHGRLQPRAW